MADEYAFRFGSTGTGFKVDDLVIARRSGFDKDANRLKLYEVRGIVTKVEKAGEATISVYKGKEFLPAFGSDITFTRFGNTTDTKRQGSIFMSADDIFGDNNFDDVGNVPYIDIRDGVSTDGGFNSLNTLKVRLGNLNGLHNAIFGANQPKGYGMYSENVYLTGAFVMGEGSKGFTMLADRPMNLADLDADAAQAISDNAAAINDFDIPTWEDIKPAFFDNTPEVSGLFLSGSNLGYYKVVEEGDPERTVEGWRTYMDINGDFYLKGKQSGESYFMWDASNEQLTVNGVFESRDSFVNWWNTRVRADVSGVMVENRLGTEGAFWGNRVKLNSGTIQWEEFSQEAGMDKVVASLTDNNVDGLSYFTLTCNQFAVSGDITAHSVSADNLAKWGAEGADFPVNGLNWKIVDLTIDGKLYSLLRAV